MLPKNVDVSFPLYICEECSDCVPEVEFLYRTNTFEKYEIVCRFAKGCKYVHRRLTETSEDCNGRK